MEIGLRTPMALLYMVIGLRIAGVPQGARLNAEGCTEVACVVCLGS